MTIKTLRKKFDSFNIIMLSLEDTEIPEYKILHLGQANGYIKALRDTNTISYPDWLELNHELNLMLVEVLKNAQS